MWLVAVMDVVVARTDVFVGRASGRLDGRRNNGRIGNVAVVVAHDAGRAALTADGIVVEGVVFVHPAKETLVAAVVLANLFQRARRGARMLLARSNW